MTATSKTTQQQQGLQDFFTHFSPAAARKLLQKMIRSAFSRTDLLSKPDVLNLLHLKEEMEALIETAEILAADPASKPLLEKFFVRKNGRQWMDTLNEIFHAALYDGFFTTPPEDDDIYHSCRSLLKLIAACHDIYTGAPSAAAETPQHPGPVNHKSQVNYNPVYYQTTTITNVNKPA